MAIIAHTDKLRTDQFVVVQKELQRRFASSETDLNILLQNYLDSMPPPPIAYSGTWLITEPGTYHLDHNLVVSTATGTAAIIIAASNVKLDLHDHKIINNSKSVGSVGIYCHGQTNVTILCGTIVGFTRRGLFIDSCSKIKIKDIHTNDIGDAQTFPENDSASGIYVSLSNQVKINKCHCEGTISATGDANGVQLTLCDDVQVSKSRFNGNTNLGGPVQGIYIVASSNVHTSHCVSDHNATKSQNLNFYSHTAGGYYALLSSFLTFRHCTAHHISSEVDDSHGFPMFICPTNILIYKCRAEDIKSGFNHTTRTGAKVTGFEMDTTNNATIIDCVASDLVAHHPEDKQAAGFTSGLNSGTTFNKCLAKNIKCIGEGNGVGFGWAPDPRKQFIGLSVGTRWINCVAKNNDIGFDLFYQQNGLLTESKSVNNRKYGIFNGQSITVSGHPPTETNPPVTITIENIGSHNIIMENEVCGNDRNIVDQQVVSTNEYSDNDVGKHC